MYALVVEAELDGPADLREVGLGALAEGVDDGTEAVEHHVGLIRRLLLEGIEDAIDEELLQSRVDVCRALVLDALLDGLHHHAPVRLILVLQKPICYKRFLIIGPGPVARFICCC